PAGPGAGNLVDGRAVAADEEDGRVVGARQQGEIQVALVAGEDAAVGIPGHAHRRPGSALVGRAEEADQVAPVADEAGVDDVVVGGGAKGDGGGRGVGAARLCDGDGGYPAG